VNDNDLTPTGANHLPAGFTVLVIDSDAQERNTASRVVADAGHDALEAADLPSAAKLLVDQAPDLIVAESTLLDGDGRDSLGDLRRQASQAQVVLTGVGPPGTTVRSLSRRHVIFGYHDKNHGSDGLRLWLNAASARARDAGDIERTRRRLQQVVESVPALHKIQSLDDVVETILERALELMEGRGGFVAARMSDPVGKPPIEGFSESVQTIDDYVVGAVTADGYLKGRSVDSLSNVPLESVSKAVQDRRPVVGERYGVLPLVLAEHVLGLAFVESVKIGDDGELLQLFGNQAAAAIRNAVLFELATIDATTRVFQKAFTLDRLRETLKLAWRKAFPVSVLMIDINSFKELNDRYGHVTGDRALRHLGELLKANVRDSDIVGRFGGDEFLVILIDANHDGADIVAERLYQALAGERVRLEPGRVPPLETSMGMATLDPGDVPPMEYGLPDFAQVMDTLVHEADASMYAARRQERGMFRGRTLNWADFGRSR
jgi:diguanylate cyclase (GGDEF)-like protein